MRKTEEIFKKFEADVNRLSKKYKDMWDCFRIAAGNLTEEYTDEELLDAARDMKNLDHENADTAGILISSEIYLKHCVFTDKDGVEHPMEYERKYEEN